MIKLTQLISELSINNPNKLKILIDPNTYENNYIGGHIKDKRFKGNPQIYYNHSGSWVINTKINHLEKYKNNLTKMNIPFKFKLPPPELQGSASLIFISELYIQKIN